MLTQFLDQKSFFYFVLIVRFLCLLTLLFHSKKNKNNILFPLSCIELCFFIEKKGRLMDLTKTESYSRHKCVANKDSLFRNIYCVTFLKQNQGLKLKKKLEQTEMTAFYRNLF